MMEFVQFSVQGAAAGALYAIVALGLVLLYRGTRVLNLAHAEFGALGGYVFWTLHPALLLPVALVAGVAAGAAVGVATERLVARPLRGASQLTLVIATLGVAEVLQFGIVQLFGADGRSVGPLALGTTLRLGRIIVPAEQVLIVVTSLAIAAGLWVFLQRTFVGTALRAVAEDSTAARLKGIRALRMETVVWAASAAMSAVAAILVAPLLGLNPYFMTLVLIRAFAAALLGGMNSLGGAVVGGLLIGIIESNVQARTTVPGAVEGVLFLVVLAVLTLRPHGLFGTPHADAVANDRFQPPARRLHVRLPLPTMTPSERRTGGAAALVLVTGALIAGGAYWSFVGALAASFAIVGVSLYLLSGLAGQLSVGHAALMGIGGFGAGLLTTQAGLHYALALPLAGLAAALVAVAVGLPSFRIRGLYLAIATLVFGIAAERFLFRLGAVSGGAAGTSLPSLSAQTVLMVTLVLLVVAIVLAVRVRDSKLGRALAVVHADETLAGTWGIKPQRYKLVAFGLSGLLAGVAGVTYATLVGHITSDAFALDLSITVIVMAIVGGLGSVSGVIAGAVVLVVLPELVPGTLSSWLTLLEGGLLLGVVLFMPGGIAQLWETTA